MLPIGINTRKQSDCPEEHVTTASRKMRPFEAIGTNRGRFTFLICSSTPLFCKPGSNMHDIL